MAIFLCGKTAFAQTVRANQKKIKNALEFN